MNESPTPKAVSILTTLDSSKRALSGVQRMFIWFAFGLQNEQPPWCSLSCYSAGWRRRRKGEGRYSVTERRGNRQAAIKRRKPVLLNQLLGTNWLGEVRQWQDNTNKKNQDNRNLALSVGWKWKRVQILDLLTGNHSIHNNVSWNEALWMVAGTVYTLLQTTGRGGE